ncbi:uncharacterized protein LOC106177707 isoform X2 [Lingula anatina]|uniref:Uncharacterized protein LOC106177707 isoform X2 n=1 Tax=Lingula anatina TaxID=7574 RepID=A0A1S3K059_LINAN|nr:uncharacterized protein LOC106177707 isoform X2 [Lingula anatina]|eukprot:XP_013416018.1 uncharacterized protein LOC106177707 isoform X2 [Lingula anatina]
MATARPNPDQKNFFRMSVLIVDNALKVLQDVLQKELEKKYPNSFDPSTGLLCGVLGDGTVRTKLNRLVRSRVLNVHQQNQLYPGGNPSQSVTVGDLDITLTVLLLRNITALNPHPPLKAWDNPSDADTCTSTEATIGKVKRYRNIVYGHANKAAISDQDFTAHFSGLKSNLLDLSNKFTSEDYDAILSEPLDAALLERNQSILKEWYNYDIDVKDQLVKVIHELKEGETKLQDHVEQVHKRSEDTILKKMDSVAQNTHNKLEDISQGITQVNVGQSEMTDQLRQSQKFMEEVKDAQKQDSENIQAQLEELATLRSMQEIQEKIICDRDRDTPEFQKIPGSVDVTVHMSISPSGMEAVKSSAIFSSSQKTPSPENTQPDREALSSVTGDGSDTNQITGIPLHLDDPPSKNITQPVNSNEAPTASSPPLELTTPLCEARDLHFMKMSDLVLSKAANFEEIERAFILIEKYHAMIYDTKRQCFILRLVCPSVHSLYQLWQSYRHGELQAAVEEIFVNIKTLEDLGLSRSDINLWVEMDEDDYNECRKYIKEKTELKEMIYEDLKMTVRKGPYGSAEQTIYGIRQALMAAFTLRKEDILIKWWDYGSPGYWAVICYGIQPHHVGHIEDNIQDLPKDDLRELGVMTINIGSQTLRLTGEDVPQELGAWNVEKGDIGSEYSASESGYHTGSRLTTELDADSTCIGDYEADEGVNFYLEQPRQDSLPITSHREQIVSQIQDNVVTFITGETGSGKSTQVPQYILADCVKRRMKKVRILVAEPRQLAAVTLAERVSKEQGDPNVGCTVGYSAGDKREISKDTKITFVTTGALLENLIHRPSHFTKYTHIILDEVHERRMEFDLLLWMIRKLMTSVPNNTKLVLMSATMQKDIYVRYFQDLSSWDSAPIFVGVHQHPVTEVYLEDISDHVWTLSEDVRRYYVKKIAKCNGWDDSDFIKSVDTFLEENVKTDGPEVDKEGEELDTDEEESETDDENLEKERTGYSNLRQKIFSDHGVLHESAVKKRSYALERIVVSLIQEYLKPGETLVVFLDGKISIRNLLFFSYFTVTPNPFTSHSQS